MLMAKVEIIPDCSSISDGNQEVTVKCLKPQHRLIWAQPFDGMEMPEVERPFNKDYRHQSMTRQGKDMKEATEMT